MAYVEVHLGQIVRDFTTVDAATVREALLNAIDVYPNYMYDIFDEDGETRRFMNIFLNDEDIRFLTLGIETTLATGDRITAVPAIAC